MAPSKRIVLILLLIALPGCSVRLKGTKIPAPERPLVTARAGIRGSVFSAKTQKPIAGIAVRLADVVWDAQRKEGSYILDGAFSPGATTDKKGRFLIENVPSKEYVLFIGDPFGFFKVITDKDEKRARILLPPTGKVLNVGKVYVALPDIRKRKP